MNTENVSKKRDPHARNSLGLTEKEMEQLYPSKLDNDSPQAIRMRNPHKHWVIEGRCKICGLVQGVEF